VSVVASGHASPSGPRLVSHRYDSKRSTTRPHLVLPTTSSGAPKLDIILMNISQMNSIRDGQCLPERRWRNADGKAEDRGLSGPL
jgi:hypothetical protein